MSYCRRERFRGQGLLLERNTMGVNQILIFRRPRWGGPFNPNVGIVSKEPSSVKGFGRGLETKERKSMGITLTPQVLNS